MHLDTALLLLALTVGALLSPIVAARVSVPDAVIQIGYGVLLGALGLVHADGVLFEVFAELGFILLMFGAGLEIDFAAVEHGGRAELWTAALVACGVFVVSVLLVWGAGLPVFYSLVLMAMSIGLGVTVLRETGTISAPVGQKLLIVGSIGELLTLVGMTIFDVASQVGISPLMVLELGKLAALFAVGGVFLLYLRAWTWWHPQRFRRAFEQHDASEVGVRAALVTCLAFVALAVWLHIEPVLGAFIAGAVSRMVFRDVSVLEQKMSALSSGFFVPIFFVAVGVRFDTSSLSWEGLKGALLLGGLVLLARLVPSALLVRGTGSLRDAIGVALLLGTPLTLHIAIASLGFELEVIDQQELSTIVLLAVLLAVVLPIAFRVLYNRGARFGEEAG